MNRKGFCIPIVAGVFFLMAVAAGVTRSDHIEKRYVQRCVRDGASIETCIEQASHLDTAQEVEYIRDTIANPDVSNEVYLSGLPNFK